MILHDVSIVSFSLAGYQMVHDTAEREFTADRLQPGHTYRVRICAVGQGGQSEVSRGVFVSLVGPFNLWTGLSSIDIALSIFTVSY